MVDLFKWQMYHNVINVYFCFVLFYYRYMFNSCCYIYLVTVVTHLSYSFFIIEFLGVIRFIVLANLET